ncbi:MAG: ABC transporter substrate-binding protein [Clostridia bacterium]|nr:ABC transporter substrate-binding protein [Clostridia bacterium]
MNTLKKLLALLLVLSLAIVLPACSSSDSGDAGEASGDAAGDASGETSGDAKFKIGVIQLTAHTALDAAYNGFVKGLDDSGIAYEIDHQDAAGEQTLCSTIATKFVNDKVDLILAIATPAAQAAAQATGEIPILVTAVTDPAFAGLVASNEAPGGNISGTSDMNPVADQIGLLLEIVPEAKTIGLLYNAGEDNSRLQVEIAKEALDAAKVGYEEFTASDTSQVQSVVQSMVGKVDGVYIPTDNLMADTMATIGMICTPAKIPVVAGEGGMNLNGGLATYAFSYETIGYRAAEQAVQVLRDGVDVGSIPIGFYDGELELVVNEQNAKEIGLEIPGYTPAA